MHLLWYIIQLKFYNLYILQTEGMSGTISGVHWLTIIVVTDFYLYAHIHYLPCIVEVVFTRRNAFKT